jgi:hypothetical protein
MSLLVGREMAFDLVSHVRENVREKATAILKSAPATRSESDSSIVCCA